MYQINASFSTLIQEGVFQDSCNHRDHTTTHKNKNQVTTSYVDIKAKQTRRELFTFKA